MHWLKVICILVLLVLAIRAGFSLQYSRCTSGIIDVVIPIQVSYEHDISFSYNRNCVPTSTSYRHHWSSSFSIATEWTRLVSLLFDERVYRSIRSRVPSKGIVFMNEWIQKEIFSFAGGAENFDGWAAGAAERSLLLRLASRPTGCTRHVDQAEAANHRVVVEIESREGVRASTKCIPLISKCLNFCQVPTGRFALQGLLRLDVSTSIPSSFSTAHDIDTHDVVAHAWSAYRFASWRLH